MWVSVDCNWCPSPWPTGSFPHSHGCRSGQKAGILAVNGKAECSRCSSQSNDGSSEYSGDDPVRKRWPLPVLQCGYTVLKGQSGIGTYIFGLTWMIYIYWFLNNISYKCLISLVQQSYPIRTQNKSLFYSEQQHVIVLWSECVREQEDWTVVVRVLCYCLDQGGAGKKGRCVVSSCCPPAVSYWQPIRPGCVTANCPVAPLCQV